MNPFMVMPLTEQLALSPYLHTKNIYITTNH